MLEFTDAPLKPFGRMLLETTIPTSYACKADLIHRLVGLLRENRCILDERRCVGEICLDEALNNAIQHGNKGDPLKQIRVSLFTDGCRWGAIVEDEGEGFRAEDVPDPTREENLLRESGRGIALMSEYLDELRYSGKGNRVMMVMSCGSEASGESGDGRLPAQS